MTARNTNGRFTKQADVTDVSDKTATAQAAATAAQREKLVKELDDQANSLWATIGEFFGPFTPGRTLVTFVARITLYAIGFVAAAYVITALSVAMQLGGWPLFLVAVFEIVGFICAFVASWMASDAIVNYVAAGNVSRDIKRVGSWIKARFDSTTTYAKQRMAMH